MNQDPTPQHIQAALVRAKELVERRDFDLNRAIAEAATNAQSRGITGFKVYAETRKAINDLTAPNRKAAIQALNDAIEKMQ